MTRYTRGKPTHQRVPKNSTSWEEMKSTPIKSRDSVWDNKPFKNREADVQVPIKPEAGLAEEPKTKPSKKNKEKFKNDVDTANTHQDNPHLTTESIELDPSEVKPKKKKHKDRSASSTDPVVESADTTEQQVELGNPEPKLKKKKRKLQNIIDDNDSPEAQAPSEPEEGQLSVRQKKKKKREIPSDDPNTTQTPGSPQTPDAESSAPEKKKKRNRNSNVKGFGSSKVVKVFGQFWVPPEDGTRLKGLVTSLKEKGLSRKEISTSLQNERRRAEKAGKRIRDKTCFNCRQFGHVLSDCPQANGNGQGKGDTVNNFGTEICFKCGSTEHTSRSCRKREDKFDFAKCFICSETGHISRQCPKNKRGIYPSGGSCNQCGASTHLAKDCLQLSDANSTPINKGVRSVPIKSDDTPALAMIKDPYASTEYEEDAGDMSKFSLKGTFSSKKWKR